MPKSLGRELVERLQDLNTKLASRDLTGLRISRVQRGLDGRVIRTGLVAESRVPPNTSVEHSDAERSESIEPG